MSRNINSDYLKGNELDRFKKIQSIIEDEYSKVLSSVNASVKVPYVPLVYVIPWVLKSEQSSGALRFRRWFFNLIYLDPKDFERCAIFSNLNFLERFPKYIAGGLGHEIAHILQTRGRYEINEDGIIRYMKDPYRAEIRKERDSEHFYDFFDEPIKSAIRKWNELANCKEIKEEVTYDAEIVDDEKIDKLIFGDKKRQLEQFIRKKPELSR